MSDAVEAVPNFQTIDERWNWVLDMLPAIGKDSRNEQQGFNYRSIDTVLDLLNPLLSEAGLHIIPVRQTFERKTYTTSRGSVMQTCVVTSSWQIRDITGAFIEAETVGEGADVGDKATSKAQTMAFKYLLWPSLAIAGSEDPDGSAVEGAGTQPAVATPAAAPAFTPSPPMPAPQHAPQGSVEPATEKQGKALWAISGGGKKFNINAVCLREFGCSERDLTKRQASALIDGINSGAISTDTSAPTAGVEAIAAAFPGAHIVGTPVPDGHHEF